MTEPPPGGAADGRPRWARSLAWLWLVVVVLLGLSIPYRLRATGGFDTSLLSLLPKSQQAPEVATAVERIAGSASRKLVFLIGHQDFAVAARAADACAATLRPAKQWVSVMPPVPEASVEQATEFVRGFRYGLLTPEDRGALENGEPLADRALAELYQPFSPPKLLSLEDDPLGFASRWLLARGRDSGISVREGRLVFERDGKTWILLPAELASDAMAFSAQQALAPVLNAAVAAARSAGAESALRSGFIFHAAEAATRANEEMSTIGIGSLIGVMVLMILPFGSPKPMLLVVLPVAVGTMLALAVDLLVFPRVHLITMVFGASIVGVAEDYGVHFVCGSLEPGEFRPWHYMRHIFRGLFLALLTTLVGYLALAALPFPGLQQMGLFGAVGLIGGWITAMLWLPPLSRKLGKPRFARLVPRLVQLEARWPRVGTRRWLPLLLGSLLLASVVGLTRARTSDNVRALYDSVPELSHEDDQVRSLLRAPAGSQFFVVRAGSSEQLLQREEALTKLLSERQQRGKVLGWQALSDQVPSRKTQEAHRALLAERVYAPAGQAERLFTALEDPETLTQARSLFAAQQRTLSLEEWLQSPLSAPVRHLFLGSAPQTLSIVLLRGTPTGADLAELSALGQRLEGVTWVDQVADISQVLGGFRRALSWMLPIGYTLVALCLVWFYGKSSWRVSAPAAFASLVALGIPALFGQPVTLFDLLALVLVLGMGVDYGIFMNEPRGAGFGVAFLSVSLGAASTLLSFGLLACSGTPALSNFGLTLLIGIGISWFLTPCFAKYSREPEAHANQQGEAAHAN